MNLQNSFLRPVSVPSLLLGAASLWAATGAGAQTLGLYLSPAGEQTSTRAGAVVEPFTGAVAPIAASGTLANGTWSGATAGVTLRAADRFGGADGAGTYLGIASGDQLTVTLTGERKYVGFWWSAGNDGNTIEFYDDTNTLLAQFTTNTLTALLGGGGSITAIDGSPYAKVDYFGNPNPWPNRNLPQPYGYVNLVLEGASVNFKTIVIRQTDTGGFELDNLAVADTVTVPGTWVHYGDVPVTLPAGAIGSVNDAAITQVNMPVSGNVASNDTTVAGSTFAVTAGPTHGTVALNPSTGAYTYTPQTGFVGEDSFTYQHCKPAPDQATCVTALVKVSVGLKAVNDTTATAVDTPRTASVAPNDLFQPGSTFSLVTPPVNGAVVMTAATGAYTYTPNAGYSGVDSFVYKVCLPAPASTTCDQATVTITVAPQAVPVASSVAINGTPAAGQPVTGSYVYSDINADEEGTSTFRWVRSPTNSLGDGSTVSTGRVYNSVASDKGAYLFFCVTPVAVTGASPGVEVCSPARQVAAPTAVPTLSEWALVLLSVLMGTWVAVSGRVRR